MKTKKHRSVKPSGHASSSGAEQRPGLRDKTRPKGSKTSTKASGTLFPTALLKMPLSKLYETVHHPKHYNIGDVEHMEMVEDQGYADGYYFGQVTKYLFRAARKPGVESKEDLRKAQWYMNRWVAWLTHGKKLWKVVARKAEYDFKSDPNP